MHRRKLGAVFRKYCGPTKGDRHDRTSRDKDRVHVLETAVVTWTSQIKSVLKNDPEAALAAAMAKGEYPGPKFGLEFWQHKEANLRLITQQLESEQLRKVRPAVEPSPRP